MTGTSALSVDDRARRHHSQTDGHDQTVLHLARPLVRGEARLRVAVRDGATRLAELHQRDPLSLRLPAPARGDIFEACVITTSGGIVGGDRLALEVAADAGSRLRAYPQAAEKIYRSLGPESRIDLRLSAGRGAWLEWLPQETILFEGARLRRESRLDLAAGARVMAGEMLVFGRRASGESLTRGSVHDGWRVYEEGRLRWADAFHLSGDLAAALASPACLGGCGAAASFIYAAPDAPARLEALRRLLPPDEADARQALSAVNGLIVGRFLGEARALRRAYGGFWAAARAVLAELPPQLPRLWHL